MSLTSSKKNKFMGPNYSKGTTVWGLQEGEGTVHTLCCLCKTKPNIIILQCVLLDKKTTSLLNNNRLRILFSSCHLVCNTFCSYDIFFQKIKLRQKGSKALLSTAMCFFSPLLFLLYQTLIALACFPTMQLSAAVLHDWIVQPLT